MSLSVADAANLFSPVAISVPGPVPGALGGGFGPSLQCLRTCYTGIFCCPILGRGRWGRWPATGIFCCPILGRGRWGRWPATGKVLLPYFG